MKLHPASRCFAVSQIEVEIMDSSPDDLMVSFTLTGRMSDVLLPPRAPSTRSDRLSDHTCFEAFFCSSHGAAYYEFNFSPSSQWAAYRFTSYRSGKDDNSEIDTIPISIHKEPRCFQLRAALTLGRLSGLGRLGLSAVIEETSGQKSHWALAHPPGRPDFHRPECFIHELSSGAPT